MNPTDYYEIHMELVHAIGNVWEIWLTVTFAVVVAFHIGRDSINRILLVVGSTLYVAVGMVTFTRYMSYAGSIGLLRQEALAAGLPAFPQDVAMAMFMSVLSMATIAIGTVATVVYAIHQYRRNVGA